MEFTKNPPSWMIVVEKFDEPMTGARGSDMVDGHTLALEAWPDSANDNSGLTSFAYLWRRFGPPPCGSDDHKDLCGYCLGTPMEEVLLTVYPSGSPLSYAIGYLVTRKIDDAFMKPMADWHKKVAAWAQKNGTTYMDIWGDKKLLSACQKAIGRAPKRNDTSKWRKNKGIAGKVNAALFAAMSELLRPVYIRDVAVNILGRCEDRDHPAPVSDLAGYGVPVDKMRKMYKVGCRARAWATQSRAKRN